MQQISEWARPKHRIETIRWGCIDYKDWLERMADRMKAETEIRTGVTGNMVALFRMTEMS